MGIPSALLAHYEENHRSAVIGGFHSQLASNAEFDISYYDNLK